jgi:hypothetical protein
MKIVNQKNFVEDFKEYESFFKKYTKNVYILNMKKLKDLQISEIIPPFHGESKQD